MSTIKLETVKEFDGQLFGRPKLTVVDGFIKTLSFHCGETSDTAVEYTVAVGESYSSSLKVTRPAQPKLREQFCVEYKVDGALCVFRSWSKRDVERHMKNKLPDMPVPGDGDDVKEFSRMVVVDEADPDKIVSDEIPF